MTGRLVADVRSFPSGCSVLLEVDRVEGRRARGRTELQLADCSALLQQGWHVRASGELRRPMPGAHPLLPGSAERLARQGSWSRLRVDSIDVLRRPWTPLADLRRDVAKRVQQAAGPRRGGFLAALVLGSAQVQLPEDIRQAFRIAGLSHALAASGFHLSVLLWPVQQMAGLLIAIASWIGHWPGAQLLTGRPQLWVIALLVVGLLPWLLWAKACSRSWSLIPMASALFFHGLVQFGDGLVAVKRFGRHWLLARHLGRAALVSTHGDARSCRMAQRIAAVHGHARLDGAVLLDPVATDVLPCWQELAHRVEANQQGRAPIAMGQELRSDGLSVQRFQHRAGSLVLRVGQQRWLLLPMLQVFWTLQAQQGSGSQHVFAGIWLGFKPSAPQRRWLLQHWAGSRFIGL